MAALGEGGPPAHSLEMGWAFLGTFQGRPNSPPFTLGGNGTGHTSHRKLTSKERVREECWLVPFPGLAFRAAPVPSAAYISLHGSGQSHCDQRGCCPYLARDAQGHMVRVVWPAFRLQFLGSFESLVLPRCLWVLGTLVPKQYRIDFYYEYS